MIVPLILWILIFLFFIPFYLITLIIFIIYRNIVNLIVWKYRSDLVEHFTTRDLPFTSEDLDGKLRKNLLNTCITIGKISIHSYRAQIIKMISGKPFFLRLHCRPYLFMGYWFWQKKELNIENHVFEWNETLTEEDLKQFLPSWNQKGYHPDCPMWAAILVPLTSGRTAVVFKIHHTIADGVSFMKLLENYPEDGGWTSFKTPEAKSFTWKHWIYAWYNFPWNALKSFRLARVRKGFRPTAFAGEGFTSWTTLSLEKIRVVRKSTKCLFQSVLAGILANAFQKLLEKTIKPEKIPTVVRLVIPLPWPNRTEKNLSNHVAFLHADLPIGSGLNPLYQFEKNVKDSYISGMHGVFWQFFRGMYYVPAPLLRTYICWGERELPPVILSSIPGTPKQFYLCGSKVVESFPLLSLGCTMGVNACVATYGDVASFTIRVSKEVLSSQELVDKLLNKYLHEELDAYYLKIISEQEIDKKPNEVHILMSSS